MVLNTSMLMCSESTNYPQDWSISLKESIQSVQSFAENVPKNVVWGSITICKASYWHHNTAKFHSSIPSLTHLWISRSLWDHLFGGCRQCLVVLIFKWKIYQFLEGGGTPGRKIASMYTCMLMHTKIMRM